HRELAHVRVAQRIVAQHLRVVLQHDHRSVFPGGSLEGHAGMVAEMQIGACGRAGRRALTVGPALFTLRRCRIPAREPLAMKPAILMLRIALSLLAAWPAAAVAQASTGPARDALLGRLEGRWIATGMIVGKPVAHDIDAAWVLAHQYLLVHEVSRE